MFLISKYLKMAELKVPAWCVSTVILMLYFHLLFRRNLYRISVFRHCGYDRGIFPDTKTLSESFCPVFFLFLWAIQLWLQELTPSKLAGRCCVCTGLLSLVAFQAPSCFMAEWGEHRKSRLSVSLKTTWKSRYQWATDLNCYLLT